MIFARKHSVHFSLARANRVCPCDRADDSTLTFRVALSGSMPFPAFFSWKIVILKVKLQIALFSATALVFSIQVSFATTSANLSGNCQRTFGVSHAFSIFEREAVRVQQIQEHSSSGFANGTGFVPYGQTFGTDQIWFTKANICEFATLCNKSDL